MDTRQKLDAQLAAQVLRTYADLAYAGYSDAAEGARAMHTRLERLVQSPSSETLDEARQSWLRAREPYVQTETFRFYDGPIDRVELLVNTWPIDENYVDCDDADTPGLVQDRQRYPKITAEVIEKLNMRESETSVSTGYHVIEFLLWGRDTSARGPGARPFTDFVPKSEDSVEARRGRYLLLASELLIAHLEQVADAWAPARDNYRAQFLSMDPRQALGLVIKGMGALSGPELAGERLTVAYETKDQENEHSCFSDTTHLDLVGNAAGIENICLGRYTSRYGRSVTGPGLCALVKSVDPELSSLLEEQLHASVAVLRAIPAPFDQAILGSDEAPGRRAVLRSIRALEAQARTLTRVATRLGVDLGLAGARAEAP